MKSSSEAKYTKRSNPFGISAHRNTASASDRSILRGKRRVIEQRLIFEAYNACLSTFNSYYYHIKNEQK